MASQETAGLTSIGDLIPEVLDSGSRSPDVVNGDSRPRRPTNSERLNRALVELRPSAFKVHTLLWKWRGAPARGRLPFFTIHSIAKFCELTRPTVRAAVRELLEKGWILGLGYNKHHKNELYKLVPIREVPEVAKDHAFADVTDSKDHGVVEL